MDLIPPFTPAFESESNAEYKVARALSRVQGDGAAAFHSFHLSKAQASKMTEADFVVLWEGAILILEVKGGSLGRTDGRWHQTGRTGKHLLAKSPFDQARRARFAFKDLMERLVPHEDYSYGHAVVTPDCVLAEDPEIPAYEYISMLDVDPSRLARRLDYMAKEARTRPDGSQWPKKDLGQVRKLLRRDLDSMISIVQFEEVIERRRVDLLRDQVDFLDSASINPRIVLEGGAGTGKTLVALEGASREAAKGSSVAFICSTPDALAAAHQIVGQAGITLVRAESLPLSKPVDLLVVDEAQDLMNAEDLDRIFTSVSGGMDSGRWWLLLDANNQAHVAGKFDEDAFELVTSTGGCARVRLTRNVRNTDPVIQAAQVYLGADLGSSRIGAGPRVEVHPARDDAAVLAMLGAWIQSLRAERVPNHHMAIVDVGQYPLFHERHSVRGRFDGIRVWTAAEIKGLEYPYVMLVGLNGLDNATSRNNLYVGMTRASVSLWMAALPAAWEILTDQVRRFHVATKDRK